MENENNQPPWVVNAIFGNNNRLDSTIYEPDEKSLIMENERLKNSLAWAMNQLKIKDAIIKTLLE